MKNRLGFSIFAITLIFMGLAVLPVSVVLFCGPPDENTKVTREIERR